MSEVWGERELGGCTDLGMSRIAAGPGLSHQMLPESLICVEHPVRAGLGTAPWQGAELVRVILLALAGPQFPHL